MYCRFGLWLQILLLFVSTDSYAARYEIGLSTGTTFHKIPTTTNTLLYKKYRFETSFIPPGLFVMYYPSEDTGDKDRTFAYIQNGQKGFIRRDDASIRTGGLLYRQIQFAKEEEQGLFVAVRSFQVSGDLWVSRSEGPYIGRVNESADMIELAVCQNMLPDKFKQIQELPSAGLAAGKIQEENCFFLKSDPRNFVEADLSSIDVRTGFIHGPKAQTVFPILASDKTLNASKVCGSAVEQTLTTGDAEKLSASLSMTAKFMEFGVGYERNLSNSLQKKISLDSDWEGFIQRFYLIREDKTTLSWSRSVYKKIAGCKSSTEDRNEIVYNIESVETPLKVMGFIDQAKSKAIELKSDAEERLIFSNADEYEKIREIFSDWVAENRIEIEDRAEFDWVLNSSTLFKYKK